MANILITGGTGFIGSHIVMKMVNHGHNVCILARNPDKITAFKQIEQISFVKGEISDRECIDKAVKGMDYCIHVALNYNDSSALNMAESDTIPSIYLATKAAEAGVEKFIYTSSTAVNDFVYMTDRPKYEGNSKHFVAFNAKQNPVTYYGATKAATENYLLAIGHQTDMRINIVRPGYTFGNPAIEGAPAQADTRFKNIVQNAVDGKEIELTKNDGTQFIFAGDLAEIYAQIIKTENNRECYFGLSRDFVSWEDIAKEAIKRCNSASKLILNDENWSDNPILFDVSAIKRDFGLVFNPWEEIRRHIDFYKDES